MLFAALSILGYVSYRQLPVELLPNAELPVLFVQVVSAQEMDPSYVESEVIIPLEGAIRSTGGIDRIQSTVDSRNSYIQIEFKKNISFGLTSVKLQNKINEAARSLPDGFAVQVQKVDIRQMMNNFMSLQARGSGGTSRIRNVVDREIRSVLESVDGIAAVNVYGGREKAIEVRLNTEACKALNLTPAQISSILSRNTQEKTFAGYVSDGGKYFVHVDAQYTQASELENIVVSVHGPVLLKDVATVFYDMKEETTYSRVDGKEAVSISLINDSQANIIELSHRTLACVEEINARLAAQDVEVVVSENTAATMENNINQIINLAITGSLLAIAILWVFLRSMRLVFFIALSIPISVYTAFNLFYAAGISINSLTLVGMALAIGMLLDNSVVVLENIYRLSGMGYSAERSVTQGAREVWRSILAATLTTVTVFLPFVFSDNFLIKLIGRHIGVSIISTLAVSLLVALLLIPMGAYAMLRGGGGGYTASFRKVSLDQRAVQIYLVLLKTCMRNPANTVLGSIALLFVTIAVTLALNISQMKEVEANSFNTYVSMQPGSSLENTDLAVRAMEERLSDFPEKKELSSRVQEREAVLTMELKDDYRSIGSRSIAEIRSDVQGLLDGINGAEVSLLSEAQGRQRGGGSGMSMGGSGSFMRLLGIGDSRERMVIRGSDFEMMRLVAEDFRYYLEEQSFIASAGVSYSEREPEVLLDFDRLLLSSYGIGPQDVSAGLMSLGGEMASGSSFKVGDSVYDIIIREDTPSDGETGEAAKVGKTVDDLRSVQIRSSTGGGIYPLESLADIGYGQGRSQIMRVNRDKQVELSYAFSGDVTSSKTLLEGYRTDIDRLVAGYNLPPGVAVEVFHEEDLLGDFKFLILAAFVLIFMILASVFESVVTPFVLLFSIPLAAIGSLLAILITGNSLLNANTLMGFLILLGVVVNNSILLIDYANILRARGYRRNRALMAAGLSRVRPILITAVTTVVAMLPLAMGDQEYAGAIGAPFAITVIGGLSFSTLLTLVIVPTACLSLENALAWYRRLSLPVKLLHLALFSAGALCIYLYAEGALWQSIYLVTLIILIPGATYFTQNSLRRANAKLIDPSSGIHITLSNVVKIYERPSRFVRQWNSGSRVKAAMRAGDCWPFALLGFGVYFTYFYLESGFRIFTLSFAIYAGALYLWNKVCEYLRGRSGGGSKWIRRLDKLVFWAIPAVILLTLALRLGNGALIIVTALLWGLGIAVYRTSRYLYDGSVKIERVKGRFAGLRRQWYRMVKSIPGIGKRRSPFKALRGVSFEIRTGMFGLLGPNGAGKSTLMRIICGILEQSYGCIRINGLDTRIYREELQSLIGFLPQEFGTYEQMTAQEFLDYQAILKGITAARVRAGRIEYVLRAVHIYERRNEKIASFSGGMKQRVGIAMILLHLPRILVVDEPTAGLDPRERIRFRNLLVELSRERIVIFSTHIIEDISSSCDQLAVVDKGMLKYYGHPSGMVKMAEGKVWSFRAGKDEFEAIADKQAVVHHMQEEDGQIRLRYISSTEPSAGALPVEANLEDAYICLLRNI
jgi:multidrug efflux pump subunit AcrB/ABC-type multidrug transport system ATPase subunit